MKNEPIFSVLTPTYNCSKFIRRSYNSLLAQTNESWEWIVINDGSTDDSELILNEINDDRVKVVSYEINKGRGYARNLGLSYCTRDIVVIWDIDDIYLPQRLEFIFKAIKIDKYDFFASKALVVDNDFNFKGIRGFYQDKMCKSFVHPTLAFKQSLKEVVHYDKDMKAGEDLFMMIVLSNKFKGFYLPKCLMLYFEEREINLNKTIQMHKSHSLSIKRIFNERIINISLRDKNYIRMHLILKRIVLNLFKIHPSWYLKTVKYRKISNDYANDELENSKMLIAKYKNI